jgi:hypothetical protein
LHEFIIPVLKTVFILFKIKKAWLFTRLFYIFNPAATYFPMTLTIIVSSAQESLTSVFGMGTGVAPPASPPET